MSATNDFVPFCPMDTGTNLLSQADYLTDPDLPIGNQPGIARLQLVNKALRQATYIASCLAQFLANATGQNVFDDATQSEVLATMALPYGFFQSSLVNTDSSAITSGTFTTFDNSPAFTFTPTISGTYKVKATVPLEAGNAGGGAIARIFNTSANATLLAESQGSVYLSLSGTAIVSVTLESIYTLVAGTPYVFDIQGESAGATDVYIRAFSFSQFYMFAEKMV